MGGIRLNKIKLMTKSIICIVILFFIIVFTGIGPWSSTDDKQTSPQQKETANTEKQSNKDEAKNTTDHTAIQTATTNKNSSSNNTDQNDSMFEGYDIISIDYCSLSGNRRSNVAVDIGVGDREYWAFTNEYGQLVKVVAKEITLQNDATEDVKSSGRYCNDEAKVSGVESSQFDEGHIIADSLGGVSNAYNITPQDSTLNRTGKQADMEEDIRKAGGCSDFTAIITYPNTSTMIPSKYSYTYKINDKTIKTEFDNAATKKKSSSTSQKSSSSTKKSSSKNSSSSKKSSSNTSSKSSSHSDQNTPTTQKVWISATGSKYHNKNNCGRMNPNKASQVSLSEAKSRGLEPCSKCF